MSRKGPAKKRKISPDPKYGSVLVTRFINKVLRKGKKELASRMVYQAFDIIASKTKKDPLSVFQQAIKNSSPYLEIQPRRIGGATYQVPIEVKGDRRTTLAMRWIIQVAKSKKGAPMPEKLALEILDAYNNTGNVVKRKDNLHRLAEANKAFAYLARF